MNLTRCENGQVYDTERFDKGPHCNQTSVNTVLQDEGAAPTVPIDGAGKTMVGVGKKRRWSELERKDDAGNQPGNGQVSVKWYSV